MKELNTNKKLLFISLLVILVLVIWYASSTQWTRDFDLKYVDYVSSWETGNNSGDSYCVYEITNNTHRTLKDVSVVILVEDDILETSCKYVDEVASSIRPGETVEYRLYDEDVEEAVEELGEHVAFVSSSEIVKIKYSK